VTASDGAITAPYGAPTADPPSWDLRTVTPVTVVGLATAEPTAAMRWVFQG
jgi:hypothetical protein